MKKALILAACFQAVSCSSSDSNSSDDGPVSNFGEKMCANIDLSDSEISHSLAVLKSVSGKEDCATTFNSLKGFKSLDLRGQGLTELSLLTKLTNLESLDLGENSLSDIELAGNLSKLVNLKLDHNDLDNIDSLKKLSQLEKVDLSHNKVSKIDSLNELPNLREINADYNEILDVDALSSLDKSVKVSVVGNPGGDLCYSLVYQNCDDGLEPVEPGARLVRNSGEFVELSLFNFKLELPKLLVDNLKTLSDSDSVNSLGTDLFMVGSFSGKEYSSFGADFFVQAKKCDTEKSLTDYDNHKDIPGYIVSDLEMPRDKFYHYSYGQFDSEEEYLKSWEVIDANNGTCLSVNMKSYGSRKLEISQEGVEKAFYFIDKTVSDSIGIMSK